ncbi:inositol phospholipid synthesis and fat-storage-inducing TM-domain-containing protein [Pseudomassariella vexata]|uniref:Acyl-coenzyme A diphosphatase SCS3 n=1 Tax=Pseudomassariella vexata TaxID=1141098 RepID=A0A1Y2DVT4_9PEZI|nr:inositol phospholipid synthesis and fat-storage-inducing TM-domain-containing protein [Pseudomassariella vexata]ORY63402.1 inositol phospholipid synthesis and fat-storage-inducing TM-domain-containing protein [Pseudomassariella vexata]
MTVSPNDSSLPSSPRGKSRASATNRPTSTPTARNPPQLPTPLETALLAVYPILLTFGTLFSILSPQTRAAPYDASGQSHVQASAPSYFARKDNLFNVIFVKRGWGWITAAFVVLLLTHPSLGSVTRKVKAAIRWGLVTAWWVLVTQWCFGPPVIDRGFRFTGGKCEGAVVRVAEGKPDRADVLTAVACRASGGKWMGGHDISGHVFLLVLGSWFLLQEMAWIAARAWFEGRRDDRCIVMGDGAVKSAGVEAERVEGEELAKEQGLGLGGKFVVAVIGLCWWMLLMTAIYFHTWFEKLTGLLVALLGIYPIYVLPRWIPALRQIIGLPGI